jgi:hypothetical protein
MTSFGLPPCPDFNSECLGGGLDIHLHVTPEGTVEVQSAAQTAAQTHTQNAPERPGKPWNHLYFTITYTKLSPFVIDRSSVQVRSSARGFFNNLPTISSRFARPGITLRGLRTRLFACWTPGQTVPLDTHRWPSVLYIVKWSDLMACDNEGTTVVDSHVVDRAPRESALWSEPLPPHTLENVGGSELRVITVELKSPGR